MAISKQARRAEALERRAKREAARDEVMGARIRTAIGFSAAYVGTQILPRFAPSLVQPAAGTTSAVIDLLLAGVGGYFALTDDDELGDFATGAALVGVTQTLDRVADGIEAWMDKREAA